MGPEVAFMSQDGGVSWRNLGPGSAAVLDANSAGDRIHYRSKGGEAVIEVWGAEKCYMELATGACYPPISGRTGLRAPAAA